MKKPRTSRAKSTVTATPPAAELAKGTESQVLTAESKSAKPTNALICKEAWELEKLRMTQAEQSYFQIRASSSIVASFASGGAVATLVALVALLKDVEVRPVWLLIAAWGAVALLVVGSAFALAGALTKKVRNLPSANQVIDKTGGYESEAQFYRQLIDNVEGFIIDHTNRTRTIGRGLRLGVALLVLSTGLSFSLSLFIVFSSAMSKEPISKPITRSEPPMPPRQPAMDGGTIERGEKPPRTSTPPPTTKK